MSKNPTAPRYRTFAEFWPYYLSEHKHPLNRALHVAGTIALLAFTAACLSRHQYVRLWFIPLLGYGPAWIGHFLIEKNRPATFSHPFYSLLGDFKMVFAILTGGSLLQPPKEPAGTAPKKS